MTPAENFHLPVEKKIILSNCLGTVEQILGLKLFFDEAEEILFVDRLFDVTKQTWQFLLETASQPDEVFVQRTIPLIKALVSDPETMTYQLASDQITTSPAHQGVSVFQHQLNTLACLPTDFVRKSGLSDREVALIRFAALFHDIGKMIFVCSNGVNGLGISHAEVSVLLLKGVVETLEFSDEERQFLYTAILNHHFFEKVSHDQADIHEIDDIFPVNFSLFLILTFADPLSIEGYKKSSMRMIRRLRKNGYLSHKDEKFFRKRYKRHNRNLENSTV